ncbi:hypothetical protein CJ179_38630 [Rhodococcus sp. ACS1]|uniref:hypothetical protein n=1 Tax=Rhodococcus sp. ACS1 TaxID=2028570 RepID=UPI000BB13277|nr:hypothetical protein [Rhodococcus sp. ACS1]PBC38517.1 hypothetical protein CJ179_38630 [Rhodococcus sp. ACS1]
MTDLLTGTHIFMDAAGQTIGGGFEDKAERELRLDLLREEVQEYLDAEQKGDMVKIADGLLDISVIAWGTLLSYNGKNLEDILGTGTLLSFFGNNDGFRDIAAPNIENLRPYFFRYIKGDYDAIALAESNNDLHKVNWTLVDILAETWSTLIAYFGSDLALDLAAEVTRSNLDKINGKHGPIVWAGEPKKSKVLKPEGWVGPQLVEVFAKHGIGEVVAA